METTERFPPDSGGRVRFEDGSEVEYDLLIAVPPHEAPKCVVESGLAKPGGWIPVNPVNLRFEDRENVYAIGDVTTVPLPGKFKPDNQLALPKAGVFATAHGIVAANNIASLVTGREIMAVFEGKGFCFVEMGDHHAVKAEGDFFSLPHPTMARRVPDMSQWEAKHEWIRGWLREWLE